MKKNRKGIRDTIVDIAMTFEEEIFQNRIIIPAALKEYGFSCRKETLAYEKKVSGGMILKCVYADGILTGGIFDPVTDEEFIQIRLPRITGKYTSLLKEEYLDFLHDIADRCTLHHDLSSLQAVRLVSLIMKQTGCSPAEKDRRIVFRLPDQGAVFAVFQKSRAERKDTDQLLFRMAEDGRIPEGIQKPGREMFYSLYTDDSMTDEDILSLIQESVKLAENSPPDRKKWIIPANPKHYDIDHAFARRDTLFWTQTAKISPGDLVFIYYGMPYGEIRYECTAAETDLEAEPDPQGLFQFRKLMRIRKLRMLKGGRISRSVMKTFGVTSVRSARFMPEELYREIIRIYGGEDERNSEGKKRE